MQKVNMNLTNSPLKSETYIAQTINPYIKNILVFSEKVSKCRKENKDKKLFYILKQFQVKQHLF